MEFIDAEHRIMKYILLLLIIIILVLLLQLVQLIGGKVTARTLVIKYISDDLSTVGNNFRFVLKNRSTNNSFG